MLKNYKEVPKLIFLQCLMFLIGLVILKKIIPKDVLKKTYYESGDFYYKNARKCPDNAICISGQFYCKKNFVKHKDTCIRSTENKSEIEILINTIVRRMSSKVTEDCRKSDNYYEKDIINDFSNNEHINEALQNLRDRPRDYDIVYIHNEGYNPYFYSIKPDFSSNCLFEKIYDELRNHYVNILIVFILVLYFIIDRRVSYEASEISDNILYKLRNDVSLSYGKESSYFYNISFNSGFRSPVRWLLRNLIWNKVSDDILRNPKIIVYNTKAGKRWKFNDF